MGPNEPTSTMGRGSWGGWGKGEPRRERHRSGGRGKQTRGVGAEPGASHQASPREMSLQRSSGLGHHPHPPAAPIGRRGRVLGAPSHMPRGGGDGGSRQAGQSGSLLAPCPAHVPALSQQTLAAEVPASRRETLLGANSPGTPNPLPMPGPLSGGRWGGTEPRVAVPCGKGPPAEPPCSQRASPQRWQQGGTACPWTTQQAGVLGRHSQGWFRPSQEGQPGVASGSFPTHADFSKMITLNSKPKQLFLRGSLIYRGKKTLRK